MADIGYQGWTNRETWAASLHLSTTEWLYNAARSVIGPHERDDAADVLESWCEELIDELHETIDEHPEMGRPNDVLVMMDREVGSWWRVNWREVAEGLSD
jgi:hypothetical protein